MNQLALNEGTSIVEDRLFPVFLNIQTQIMAMALLLKARLICEREACLENDWNVPSQWLIWIDMLQGMTTTKKAERSSEKKRTEKSQDLPDLVHYDGQ